MASTASVFPVLRYIIVPPSRSLFSCRTRTSDFDTKESDQRGQSRLNSTNSAFQRSRIQTTLTPLILPGHSTRTSLIVGGLFTAPRESRCGVSHSVSPETRYEYDVNEPAVIAAGFFDTTGCVTKLPDDSS